MTVLDCLKPLTLSAVGNDDRMLRNKFVVVCKCPRGTDTINCQMPGPRDSICETNARGFPGGGGMLTVGIDSHISHAISVLTAKFQSSLKLTKYRQLYNGLELLCRFQLPNAVFCHFEVL